MKKFARILASSSLKLTLYFAVIIAALIGIIGTPAPLKQSLSDSKIYDGIIENVLKSVDEERAGEEQATDINRTQFQQAATAALPPETLQTSTEQVIDGIWRWLDGEVATPDFRIDLTDAKQRFISAAGQAVETHVASLPACTSQQLRTIDVNAEPLDLTCRPPTVSASSARQKVEADLASNEDFLQDPVLTADNLSKDEEGQTAFQKLDQAPKTFQFAKTLSWLLLVLSLGLGVAVFFLSDSRRQGVKSLGVTLFGTGLFLLITTWLLGFIFDRMARPGGAFSQAVSDNGLQASILSTLRSLNATFNKTVLIYSLAYLIIGGLTLVALKFLWKPAAATPVAPETPPKASPPKKKGP